MSGQLPPSPQLREPHSLRAEVLSAKDLPTIPAVLARIIAVVDGQHSSARELVEVIERDQALTSRILKLANSALFGLSRKVATVPRAVVLVGFTTVRNLALGVKLWDALAGGGRQRARVETLWHHSALVAAAAKLMASRIRGVDPDTSFTAGLLHDVGKLILSLKLGAGYWTVVEGVADGEDLASKERTHLGVDHAEVGGWLAEAWRLPPSIVAAIRDHHRSELLDREQWTTAEVVVAANQLIHGTDLTSGAQKPQAVQILERTARHGLASDGWATLFAQLKGEADTISGLFAGA